MGARGIKILIVILATLVAGVPVQARSTGEQPASRSADTYAKLAVQPQQRRTASPTLSLLLQTRLSPTSAELLQLRPTRAISIPFGFESPLLLNVERQTATVRGPGACTAGQRVHIAVSIVQEESGATAAGQTEAACTGESGGWTATVAGEAGPPLAPGPARACGVATTRDGETVTDRVEWCRDLALHVGLYLPLLLYSS